MSGRDGVTVAPRAVLPRPDLAFVCDEQGAVVDASAAAAELLGAPVGALRGRPLARLAVHEDEGTVAAGLAEARRAGTSRFSARLRTAAGDPRDAELVAWSLHAGAARLTFCAV